MARTAPQREQVLVVDDSEATREVLRRNLTAKGYRVVAARDAEEAGQLLASLPVDLVVTDLRMPGASGMDLVRHVRQHHPDTEVMMITGYASVQGAVEAVRAGAAEYLTKPFTAEELGQAVTRALEPQRARRVASSRSVRTPRAPHGLIGESAPMQKVYRLISKAARADATVLVSGESGTGKELVARAIHYSGPRASAPFVPVNCGGIPEGLLESELFGSVRGAFTGATATRPGFFQAADGGSLFLDEISETSLAMQVKLLRVLQDRQVCMVGSTHSRAVDLRVIAATNKDLAELVRQGRFREDLYYRLNVIPLELPPLRERGDDILLLIRHFTDKYAARQERVAPRFSDEALRLLRRHSWSGNVRALENVVQRMVVMVDGDSIEASDLPPLLRTARLPSLRLDRTLAEVEQDYVRRVVDSVGGNKSKAAQILGIDRKTLRVKLRRAERGAVGATGREAAAGRSGAGPSR